MSGKLHTLATMGRQLVNQCIHPTDVYEGGQEGTRRAMQIRSEDSVAAIKTFMGGSLFATSGEARYGWCKGKNHMRTGADGITTVAVLGPEGAAFKRYDQDQLEETFASICPGILVVDGTEGHQARSLTVGDLKATVSISDNKPPGGEGFMLSLAIGDNEAKDISVKDFFTVSNAVLLRCSCRSRGAPPRRPCPRSSLSSSSRGWRARP